MIPKKTLQALRKLYMTVYSASIQLKSIGINPVGGGKNQKEAMSPVIFEKNGQTFALFGFLEFLLEGIVFDDKKAYPAFGNIDSLCSLINYFGPLTYFSTVSIRKGKQDQYYYRTNNIFCYILHISFMILSAYACTS